MADAVVSMVAERIISLMLEQARYHVNLVRGAEKEVSKLADELKTIRNVLDDAEKRGFKEKTIKIWLKKLEDISYEIDDVLDEWYYAILKLEIEQHQPDDAVVAPPEPKVCSFIPSFSCLCFEKVVVRHDIAKKIQNLKAELDEVLKEKDRYKFVNSQPTADPCPETWRVQSTSLIDLEEIHGRAFDREIIVGKIMSNSGGQHELGLHILSIVGVGGLGKTTLAQLVYNDSLVEKSFDLRIWVCVSDPFDLAAIAKGIIESAKKRGSPSTNNLETLLHCVRDSILGKKFLLVLDDVWTEDSKKWEPLRTSLKCGGVGSKVLVTTRNERVAKIMGTIDYDVHHLGQLSNEDGWLLFRRIALFGRKEEEFAKFENTGKEIAKKCNGLPLAIKTLGSLLRFKSTLEEWENVLNSEIWQLDVAEVDLFPHLFLSYNELSPSFKRCFSYCAVFPKDSKIHIENLIGNWIAFGYLGSNIGDLELKGRECFDSLATRSLFQDFEEDNWDGKIKWCKMHDIVHDFAQFLRKNGRVETSGANKTTCGACDHLLVTGVNNFRSLFWDKKSPPSICVCLTRLRVLSLRQCGWQSIPQGMDSLIHLRWLNLGANKLSCEDLKIIFHLYNLQTLLLSDCSLEEIPIEIGNLIHLRRLDLSENRYLKQLPESVCGLQELRTLNVTNCKFLAGLPEGIHNLINLKHLLNGSSGLRQYPQGITKLTGLRTLSKFRGGTGEARLGLLKNLNCLTGVLELTIRLIYDLKEVVEDAREAELKKKMHIQRLVIYFLDEIDENHESSTRMDILDGLEPHPTLQKLHIYWYKGLKLPGWITSPLNQLRTVHLSSFDHLSSLPPLGKLPCLEEISISLMSRLQFVGREFSGITSIEGGQNVDTIAFPKLKKLEISSCSKWQHWGDITAEEEESANVSLMPRLTELNIKYCDALMSLPHRLLRKASSLEMLDIHGSTLIEQQYKDNDGPAWKSISQHPRLQFIRIADNSDFRGARNLVLS